MRTEAIFTQAIAMKPPRHAEISHGHGRRTCLAMLPDQVTSQIAAGSTSVTAVHPSGDAPTAPTRFGPNSLIKVVTQSTSRDINPRAGSWLYILEILRRAGVPFVERSPDDLPSWIGQPRSHRRCWPATCG